VHKSLFLCYLLTWVDREFSSPAGAQFISLLTQKNNNNPAPLSPRNRLISKYALPPLDYGTRSIFPRNPFFGLMESIVCCTNCGYKSITYSEFLSLSVPLIGQNGQKYLNLPQCLEKYTERETIPWKCDDCIKYPTKKQFYGVKQLTITRYPKILCVHLNRLVQMNGIQRKIDNFIEFNTLLNIYPYVTSHKGIFSADGDEAYLDTNSRNSYTAADPIRAIDYSLVAIIVHLGDAHGGHYVVYKRLLEKNSKEDFKLRKDWVLISDSNWELVTESQVLKQKAYLLFYEKIV